MLKEIGSRSACSAVIEVLVLFEPETTPGTTSATDVLLLDGVDPLTPVTKEDEDSGLGKPISSIQ